MYLATDNWAPGKEQYVKFDDKDINIKWNSETPIISEKDLQNGSAIELFPNRF